jgi:two-component system, chemotaxis family, chemotaxis protein CheY
MAVRILVVDDDLAIQEFMLRALIGEGYDAKVASNGAEALQIIPQFMPNLILLDMKMPVMDGWQFLEIHCQQPHYIPVIALSAHVTDTSSLRCVSEFVPKPFELDNLFFLIEKHVGAPQSG